MRRASAEEDCAGRSMKYLNCEEFLSIPTMFWRSMARCDWEVEGAGGIGEQGTRRVWTFAIRNGYWRNPGYSRQCMAGLSELSIGLAIEKSSTLGP